MYESVRAEEQIRILKGENARLKLLINRLIEKDTKIHANLKSSIKLIEDAIGKQVVY